MWDSILDNFLVPILKFLLTKLDVFPRHTSTTKLPTTVLLFWRISIAVKMQRSNLKGIRTSFLLGQSASCRIAGTSPTTQWRYKNHRSWTRLKMYNIKTAHSVIFSASFEPSKVISQRNIGDNSFDSTTTAHRSSIGQSGWSWYEEHVGVVSNGSFTYPGLLEQINTTKDVSDFLWYSTRYG